MVVPPKLAILLLSALAMAVLPTTQAQGILDPEPHECGAIVLWFGVDSDCGFWACHSEELDGCRQGCPGSYECEHVVCDYYVETPFLLACVHDGPTATVRCVAEQADLACLG